MITRLTLKSLLFVTTGLLLTTGCDSENKPKKKPSDLEESPQDIPTDNFAYDEAAEFKLDAAAFLNVNTKEQFHVGTLYFEGGTGKNCAKWEITISGEEIKLAQGEQLQADAQTRLTETAEGTLIGAFETRGTIPGIRFVVKSDSIVTFSGVQSYCKTDDRAEFSVQENVVKGRLHEIFRGVEVKGIAFMTLKFSDEKTETSVAKIKEQLAAATPADPAAAGPAGPVPAPATDPADPDADPADGTPTDPAPPAPTP